MGRGWQAFASSWQGRGAGILFSSYSDASTMTLLTKRLKLCSQANKFVSISTDLSASIA